MITVSLNHFIIPKDFHQSLQPFSNLQPNFSQSTQAREQSPHMSVGAFLYYFF